MVIIATTPETLLRINQEIHDLWIDFDLIARSVRAQRLVIDLFVDPKLPDRIAGHLAIDAVNSIELEDSEGIGRYDIKEIEYDSESARLHFYTNIPSKFAISVTRLSFTFIVDRCLRFDKGHAFAMAGSRA